MTGPEQRIAVAHEPPDDRGPDAEELARIERENLQGNHRNVLLTAEEEKRLAERMEQKDMDPDDAKAARDEFIAANKGLVCDIASRYLDRGVSYEDLVSEGHIGLIWAVDKFDRTRGWRFSTMATWWVRRAIMRAIAYQGRTIYIPEDIMRRIARVYRTARELTQELGREPYHKEVAERMKTSPDEVEDLLDISRHPDSLERPIGDDEKREFGDFVQDPDVIDFDEAADLGFLREKVREQLQKLTPQQQYVLTRRFGLDGEGAHTLEEVGQEIGLSRGRIQKIGNDALRRLRHTSTGLHRFQE